LSVYVINGLNTTTCAYSSVDKIIDGGVEDLFWGHVDYDATPDDTNPDPDPEVPVPPVVPAGTVVMPVSPARFWDSRDEATFDGQARATGRLGGASYAVQIAGRGAVPGDAKGVVANLTAIFPDGAGFATLYPCGGTPPEASHVNFGPGQVVANSAVVPLDGQGKVCVYSLVGADFALDVNGFVPADSALVGITPQRYLDTRPNRVGAGGVVEVQIAGTAQVPAGASAAFVNVTAVFPDGPGFVTLYPCGTRPTASTINYGPSQVVPNGALVNLSAAGKLCVYTSAGSDLLVDVTGYVPAGTAKIGALTPARLADSRAGQSTTDGEANGFGRLAAGETIELQVTGRGNVPAGASAATFNVAVIDPADAGYVTLFPCGTRPGTSNVNHGPGGVVANNAFTKLSPSGTVCLYTLVATDVIVDVTGWTG